MAFLSPPPCTCFSFVLRPPLLLCSSLLLLLTLLHSAPAAGVRLATTLTRYTTRDILTAAGHLGASSRQGHRGGRGKKHHKKKKKSPLTLFSDPLPLPQQIIVSGPTPTNVSAFKAWHKFHKKLPASAVYAFGQSAASASVPGPTLVAYQGQTSLIQWGNSIPPGRHLLPVDYTVGAPKPAKGGIPTSIHLHGAMVSSFYDGHPDAWWTSNGDVGPTFNSTLHSYPNAQPSSTMWYHDHTIGMTRLNVVAGLAGMYLIRNDTLEAQLGLPAGSYDVLLVLQDKIFNLKTGAIFFPGMGVNPSVHPQWDPEYFGNYVIVNGKVSPFFEVEPRRYRFRFLNAANARFFNLTFLPLGSPQPLQFYVVATDGGFLEAPVPAQSMLVAPGERAEIVADFSSFASGTKVLLSNSAPAPYIDGDIPDYSESKVMLFIVGALVAADESRVPPSLGLVEHLQPSSATVTRYITLTEKENDKSGNPEYSLLQNLHWTDPATIKPAVGATEIWTIINLTVDWHPFHIHFVNHQLLHRQAFEVQRFLQGNCSVGGFTIDQASSVNSTANPNGPGASLPSCLSPDTELPSSEEAGWSDTTPAPAGFVTSLIIRFSPVSGDPLPFDPREGPGYVMHCHILDHEDNDMMRPFHLT